MTEWHFMAFLEYCLTRPIQYYENGRRREAPIRNALPEVANYLGAYYRLRGKEPPFSGRLRRFAEELAATFGHAPRTALAASPDDVRDFVSSLSSRPLDLRTKAAILSLFASWRRPSEVLWLDYPQCLRAEYEAGIALIIPGSKTNPRSRPQPVRHTKDERVCPVCAIKTWLEYLGAGYVGPLFPVLRKGNPQPKSLDVANCDKTIEMLARRTGRPPHS